MQVLASSDIEIRVVHKANNGSDSRHKQGPHPEASPSRGLPFLLFFFSQRNKTKQTDGRTDRRPLCHLALPAPAGEPAAANSSHSARGRPHGLLTAAAQGPGLSPPAAKRRPQGGPRDPAVGRPGLVTPTAPSPRLQAPHPGGGHSHPHRRHRPRGQGPRGRPSHTALSTLGAK